MDKCESCGRPRAQIACPFDIPGCEIAHLGCPKCKYHPDYRINKTTMLFEQISPELREEMLDWAGKVILTGQIPSPDPKWVTDYLQTFGYDNDRQRLLFISTAMPQRVTLSLLLDV